MKILVKFPSRERPERFADTLKEWVRLADDTSNLHFLFSFDRDDESMWDASEKITPLDINASIFFGTSNSKVHAINRDIEKVTAPWDIVLVISDDMWPVLKGWDTLIRKTMKEHHPDLDGSLWFPDGKQKDICTLPCVGRTYYDRTGEIYDHRFTSVFCDDLHTHQAKALGKLTFVDTIIAKHMHWANFSEVKKDALYLKNETQAIWDKDKALYQSIMDKGLPA